MARDAGCLTSITKDAPVREMRIRERFASKRRFGAKKGLGWLMTFHPMIAAASAAATNTANKAAKKPGRRRDHVEAIPG